MIQNPYSKEKLKSLMIPTNFAPEEIKVEDDEILKLFTCTICKCIVFIPIFCTNCDKPNCLKCLNKNIDFRKDNSCIFKCSGNQYRAMNHNEETFISRIKFKCRNKNCPEFISYLDYNSHMNNCKYKIVSCSNKPCKVKKYLYEIEEHEKECEWREITCNLCKQKIIYNNQKEHEKKECDEKIVNCIFCDKSMKRADLKNHRTKNANCLREKVEEKEKIILEMEGEIKDKDKAIKKLTESNNYYEEQLKKKESEITNLIADVTILKKEIDDKNKFIEEFRFSLKKFYNKFEGNNNSKNQSFNNDGNQNVNSLNKKSKHDKKSNK